MIYGSAQRRKMDKTEMNRRGKNIKYGSIKVQKLAQQCIQHKVLVESCSKSVEK